MQQRVGSGSISSASNNSGVRSGSGHDTRHHIAPISKTTDETASNQGTERNVHGMNKILLGATLFLLLLLSIVLFSDISFLRNTGVSSPVSANSNKNGKAITAINTIESRDHFQYSSNDTIQVCSRKLPVLLKAIKTVKSDIWKAWNISNYPLFLTTMHIPTLSWDIQKTKFVKLILEQLFIADVKSSYHNRTFVAGFSGSSVTAGHGKF